ncbi:MAG: hypothetical protein K6E54_11525 [Bacteroidaceae bacterium]|nr:hypothetical protein [Bacteroidaceae bacterium]
MEQIQLSISNVLERAWELTKKHGLLLAVLLLVAYILSYCLASPATKFDQQSYLEAVQNQDMETILSIYTGMLTHPMYFISILVGAFVSVAIMKIFLGLAKGELTSIELSACKMPFAVYVKAVVVFFIIELAVCVGMSLCVIPGIFLAVRLMWAFVYQVDNPEAGIGESFSASWNMTRGNFWPLLGLGVVTFFIAILGLLACCIGMFYTLVVFYFAMVVAYLTLKTTIE